ncbi:unnamed protein product [Rhizophagus irregularis]|nr:unnamed protein product [Rhizophagus irregularis]
MTVFTRGTIWNGVNDDAIYVCLRLDYHIGALWQRQFELGLYNLIWRNTILLSENKDQQNYIPTRSEERYTNRSPEYQKKTKNLCKTSIKAFGGLGREAEVH